MARWTRWQTFALAAVGMIAGVVVLGGTWLFYRERLLQPGNDPLSWVQPVLLVIGGLLAIVGGALLAARRSSGPVTLKLAVGVIPIILIARLIVVVLRAPSYLIGEIRANPDRLSPGALIERATNNPRNLLINLALIIAVIVIASLSKAGKSGAEQGTADGVRRGE